MTLIVGQAKPVGQVVNLRPIVNRPVGQALACGGLQPASGAAI